ncbi:SDR family NAD(P)-dependent oxidoreductase [Zhongshania aquimaris]|uniref:SDR family oxidoreductase n=1 Tax=Zhongshania aquimaris TaxID=2857107 RepID=A0ABS6VWP5_9GAMM|nr:SDR family oxidoreductase [Zhongshania aquimaris]MBW2942748.1 SDR family oxidoreductase [Zhongshania aquimaris]
MSKELEGKVAIITGGASGIGEATAELFAQQGAKVVIADINAEVGEALAAKLGENTRFKHTDTSSKADIENLVEFAVATFGGLDIMFNNAGISGAQYPRFLDDDMADFEKVIGVNLRGVMIGSQCAARYMAKNGGGVILNNASIAGIVPGQALMSYRVSKAAVIHFTKCSAIDFAEYGIRVCAMAPGHIRTPLTAFTIPGMSSEQMVRIREALAPVWDSNQPLKRHGRPVDVAQTALFICSEKAAQITGVVLPIDGGITAGDPVNHLQELFDARSAAIASFE